MMPAEYSDHVLQSSTDQDRPSMGGWLGTALAFLIPAVQFIQLHVVGTLYASDLLALATSVIGVASGSRALGRRPPRTFLVLGVVWLLAQVLSDLIRATAFRDYARGWAMIVFALLNFAALYLLLSNRRRIVLCTLGFIAGGLLTYLFSPSSFADAYPWKFGYGYSITLSVVLIAVFFNSRHRKTLAIAAIMTAAGLNLYYDYRSVAGECFVAAAYLLLSMAMRRRGHREKYSSPAMALIACIVLALSVTGLFRIYAYCAGNGLLGYAAWQKYEIQSSGRYGVLIGGRGDFLTGLAAAADSPVVGHGSWARDWRYAPREDAMFAELGYKTSDEADSWTIPAHSYLVGAWVHAGILGALFWLWVLSLPVRVLMRPQAEDEPLAPMAAFFSASLIWDILFSPFGAAARLKASFIVVTLMWILDAHRGFPKSVRSSDEVAHDEFLDRYHIV